MQVAEGLQAVHEKGVTHRDIKSSNIMVTELGIEASDRRYCHSLLIAAIGFPKYKKCIDFWKSYF